MKVKRLKLNKNRIPIPLVGYLLLEAFEDVIEKKEEKWTQMK